MNIYDIAVVGAGPAGIMASIRAAELKKNVVLIEKNNSIGRKILLTGKGRCNLTNSACLDEFIEKFGKKGQFLRSAFDTFFNQDLMDFIKSRGLRLKVERQGRVFPKTDSASSVVETLRKTLSSSSVEILYNRHLIDIRKQGELFQLHLDKGSNIQTKKVILATGGASFSATGSTGDGFKIAKRLGHTIIPLKPGLVPLKTAESWVKQLQGLALKNVRLSYIFGKRKIISEVGEMLFAHFGISGPLVLDLSSRIVGLLDEHKKINLLIDLKPALTPEQLENRLLREIKTQGNKNLKNMFRSLLPLKLVKVFINLLGLNPDKKANQITQKERRLIAQFLKALPLRIVGSLPIEQAMITCGGVCRKEIDPCTMESKIVPGLYFAGEIIDVAALSGGYNLQAAFSTGYLAGQSTA